MGLIINYQTRSAVCSNQLPCSVVTIAIPYVSTINIPHYKMEANSTYLATDEIIVKAILILQTTVIVI